MTEPVLKEEIDRFVVLPVNSAYQDLWDMYKYHQKMFLGCRGDRLSSR